MSKATNKSVLLHDQRSGSRPEEREDRAPKSWAIVEKRDRTRTGPRIWAVIIGDTTCGISLVTDTIRGSNFAIPSTTNSPRGNGANFCSSGEESVVRKQRGAAPSHLWLGAPASSKGPDPLGCSVSAGTENRSPFFVRGPSPRSFSRGHDNSLQGLHLYLPGGRLGNSFSPLRQSRPRSPQYGRFNSPCRRIVGPPRLRSPRRLPPPALVALVPL